MRVLTFTSLYPSEVAPRHGIFVKNRMEHFDRITETSRMVIAPVHYIPLLGLNKNSRFHHYNQIAKKEIHGNIPVYHPRYITIPGTNLINVARAMATAADRILAKIPVAEKAFDLIDGHYLYPDGIAASILAKKYHIPLILTARGSDVNFWLEQEKYKKNILKTIDHASKIICVSHDLKHRLIRHGVAGDKLIVIMNGVEQSIFNAGDKDEKREKYLLSVGNLVALKGHEFILHSLTELPEEKLIIIGAGELENHLKEIARRLNISDRVTFLPPIPQQQLAAYYRRAKVTILMSSMEGMPNVILESLACGTPVIATNVGGIPEVITEDNGILLKGRTTKYLTEAIASLPERHWSRKKILDSANQMNWPETARQLHHVFSQSLLF